tara:strand:- start:589 stop:1167 length:579 start_codon:yes stop_codon:yes gene_type:complete
MIIYGNTNSKNAMLFLHGYNQSPTDAKSKLMETIHVDLLEQYSIVIFFPGRKWFSYKNETSFQHDNDELYRTRIYLHKLIETMEKRFSKLLLSGYSQGACTAIDAAFTYTKYQIPTLSISGFPILQYATKGIRTLYATHGKEDSCITLKKARKSYKSYDNIMLVLSESDHWGFWNIKPFQLFFENFVKKHLM